MSGWASIIVYQTVLNVFSGTHMKYYHKLLDKKELMEYYLFWLCFHKTDFGH